MHTSRVTVGFITVLVMACCLALGGFASSALAKTIVVTTLTDTADPPFDADGPCGTGTISDLPGTDNLISLREAIIAANNTSGADTITFVSGGTIVVNFDDGDGSPDPLPALCGGHTRIDGDLNGDDAPDITLESSAFPAAAAGILVVSSHNTIQGLHVRHFSVGIGVQAGDFPTPGAPGTIEHTTVRNNILAESLFHGIAMVTGDTPGSVLAHTTITQNLVEQNAFDGILILANLTAAGADTRITQTILTNNEVRENGSVGIEMFLQGNDNVLSHATLTDNEVRGNGVFGIFMVSLGDHNVLSHATLAQNTVVGNAIVGITAWGGFGGAGSFGGADENTLGVDIKDNTVTDSNVGIHVVAGRENSSHNRVVARIRGNTLERHQIGGIEAGAGTGAVSVLIGTSNNNVLDLRIERNTVRNQTGDGIVVVGGGGVNGVADGNQTTAVVMHNTVEDNNFAGIGLAAGDIGRASSNILDVRVAHNTVCNNGTDIVGEGGYSGGNPLFPVPNMGTGNVLTGEISKNTATTVTVDDGTPGNTATVTQSKNVPCL